MKKSIYEGMRKMHIKSIDAYEKFGQKDLAEQARNELYRFESKWKPFFCEINKKSEGAE